MGSDSDWRVMSDASQLLTDFGVPHETRERLLVVRIHVAGTPLYMAPEQTRGDRVVDARADIFAVACVLVECITGRPLFQAGGLADLAIEKREIDLARYRS